MQEWESNHSLRLRAYFFSYSFLMNVEMSLFILCLSNACSATWLRDSNSVFTCEDADLSTMLHLTATQYSFVLEPRS